VSREAFEGFEFDWFAVDATGHVCHFSTAGSGPVPLSVLDRLDAAKTDALWSLGRRLLTLPVIGAATGHLPGRIDDWLELARRGLFSFDWPFPSLWSRYIEHSYRRAATPSVPLEIVTLSPELQRLIRLVEFPGVRFGALESVRPEALCPWG
jgi:hypothetical protein